MLITVDQNDWLRSPQYLYLRPNVCFFATYGDEIPTVTQYSISCHVSKDWVDSTKTKCTDLRATVVKPDMISATALETLYW